MKKVVVLGGGTAGCIAVSALARHLKPELYQVTVIESSHIASIGLGESLLPSVVSYLHRLGLDEVDFMQKTGASIKLGTQFRDWSGGDPPFFQPLGRLRRELNGYDFFDCWLKARSLGDTASLQEYAPAAVMASAEKFDFPARRPAGSALNAAGYAFHVDAGLACKYLREFAQKHKVKYIKAHVVRVNLDESGCIESLELNNRETVEGDLFLDCSGHRGLLINEALHSDYESWKHFLPCDRAVATQASSRVAVSPYSVSTAVGNGWVWRIPMQERVSHGYVFSSEHTSDREAMRVLLDSVEGKPLLEPRFIPFRNGLRKKFWQKNCVSLGLAGGFLEPLASTAIHLAIRGVEDLLELFPNFDEKTREWPVLAAEYNRRMRVQYEEIRDFIILHYCSGKRADTEFWRRCKSGPVPESLEVKIELFKYRGELQGHDDSLFSRSDWQILLTGMGVIPRTWHPFVDMADFGVIHQHMLAERAELNRAVGQLPDFRNFIRGASATVGG